jgi:hypothetical protein
MTTKVIAGVIIVLVLLGGWGFYKYWDHYVENQNKAEQEAAKRNIQPEQLPGMPYDLQASLDAAQKQGAAGLRNWLATHDRVLQDPRKAWIQLDYCVLLSSENPNEAKRVFAAVKQRTPTSSPVWPRIRELEKSYE